eukprot:TRINITY_DN5032_c1_g1_i1.p1 TRINITY_DN5032_c1_g1~~TRINITY_DN5032_c1_g1_i1.p1  ORF type:complete len:119 (+),score=21.42 TRINITY_DN5032_c1_g1_i1:40-357(+)
MFRNTALCLFQWPRKYHPEKYGRMAMKLNTFGREIVQRQKTKREIQTVRSWSSAGHIWYFTMRRKKVVADPEKYQEIAFDPVVGRDMLFTQRKFGKDFTKKKWTQ